MVISSLQGKAITTLIVFTSSNALSLLLLFRPARGYAADTSRKTTANLQLANASAEALRLSPQQLEALHNLVNTGDRAGYYQQLADYGHRYGDLGLAYVQRSGFGGSLAHEHLLYKASQHLERDLTESEIQKISNDIMKADFEFRYNKEGLPLNPTEIARYHYEVFDSNGLPRNVWTAYHLQELGIPWCYSCSEAEVFAPNADGSPSNDQRYSGIEDVIERLFANFWNSDRFGHRLGHIVGVLVSGFSPPFWKATNAMMDQNPRFTCNLQNHVRVSKEQFSGEAWLFSNFFRTTIMAALPTEASPTLQRTGIDLNDATLNSLQLIAGIGGIYFYTYYYEKLFLSGRAETIPECVQ